jgi:hypothetical protein
MFVAVYWLAVAGVLALTNHNDIIHPLGYSFVVCIID